MMVIEWAKDTKFLHADNNESDQIVRIHGMTDVSCHLAHITEGRFSHTLA